MKLRRKATGSSAIELPLLFIVMVPAALLAINICTIGLGSFVNEAACREAELANTKSHGVSKEVIYANTRGR